MTEIEGTLEITFCCCSLLIYRNSFGFDVPEQETSLFGLVTE